MPKWKQQCVDDGDERHSMELAKEVAKIAENDGKWESVLAGFLGTKYGKSLTLKKPKRTEAQKKEDDEFDKKWIKEAGFDCIEDYIAWIEEQTKNDMTDEAYEAEMEEDWMPPPKWKSETKQKPRRKRRKKDNGDGDKKE